MGWDISIINGDVNDRLPLGPREVVIAAVAKALPGVVMECPPIPPKEMLDIMPPIVRENALNPNLEAVCDIGDLTIRFYALNQPVLHWINAEVRGNDDPLPMLAAICRPNNWSVLDAGDKQIVDLNKTDDSAWDRFREWRDYAFRQALPSDNPDS